MSFYTRSIKNDDVMAKVALARTGIPGLTQNKRMRAFHFPLQLLPYLPAALSS